MLDKTIHEVGADPKLYEVEHNLTSNDVTEQVIKGNVAIIKHTDDGETKIETPEKGASFEIYLKSAGSYDAANKDERDYYRFAMKMASVRQKICRMVFIPYTRLTVGKAER